MKQIYVASKSTGEVFKRISNYAGTRAGVNKAILRVVLSEVKHLDKEITEKWIKSDLFKVTKQTHPEYFL